MSNKNYILLVEDDEFLAELYATKLDLEGFEVGLANDGEKALKMVEKKTEQMFRLIKAV